MCKNCTSVSAQYWLNNSGFFLTLGDLHLTRNAQFPNGAPKDHLSIGDAAQTKKKLREILNTPSICEPNCLSLKRKCCPTGVKILKNLVRDPYSKKYHLFFASTERKKNYDFSTKTSSTTKKP
jgi:hypothetical protein